MTPTGLGAVLPLLDGSVAPSHGVITSDWWLAWNFDPRVLLPLAVLVLWYVRGSRRLRVHRLTLLQQCCFAAGVGVTLLAVTSPIDPLGERHFSFHMVQHELLMLVAVPLLLLGAPTLPVLRGMPTELRRFIARFAFHWRPWALVTRFVLYPPIAITQMTLVLFLWHFGPGWFDSAIRNPIIHDVQHLTFVGAAILFWWNVIDPWPLHSRIPHGARILYIAAMMAPRVLLSAILVFADRSYYAAYGEVAPIFRTDPLADQVLGGLIMWVPGESMHLIAIGLVFTVWYRRSIREGSAA